MYNLGSQFKFDLNQALGNKEAIIQGKRYRFTVLTESLIRLEYSEKGEFEDRPTMQVWYRNFARPEFYVQSDQKVLQIKTRYYTLTYQKESKFNSNPLNPSSNLKVEILSTGKVWYYKHPEVRNYISPAGEFDKSDNLLKYKGMYSIDGFSSIDDSRSLAFSEDGTLSEREGSNVDIYLFVYGNLYYRCLTDYYKITGYPSFIPRYALGIWWYKDETYNDYSLSTTLNSFENKKIPLSVLILNNDWHINRYLKEKDLKTGFTFDQNCFKEPSKMIQYLHKKKIYLGLTINPSGKIKKFEQFYETAIKYINPDKNGDIPFNIYDNVFLDLYLKIFIHSLTNMDVDLFRIDNISDYLLRFYLNHYHKLDAKVIDNRRSLMLTHDAFVAPHRYPVISTGEAPVSWENLIKMSEFNINLANRGLTWVAHAYGGFSGGVEESELYLRYIQLATFSPIFLLASARGKYYKREPWKWDYHTYVVTREFMLFRYRMIPYLYTEAYNYSTKGLPLIEPVFYRYPALYDDDIYHREYFFGSELFVSPIIDRKEEIMKRAIHKFFLPNGIWYDIYNGKKFLGNKKYVLFYSDETYPVFAKAGAIIPLAINNEINNTNPSTDLEVDIYPGASNKYVLYEDDGISENSAYSQTDIEYKYLADNYELIIKPTVQNPNFQCDKRNYKIVLKNINDKGKAEVMVDLKKYDFNVHAEANDLIIEVKNVSTSSILNIKYTGTNLEVSNFRVLNDDIVGIISDLLIETELKNKIDEILFSNLSNRMKRIEIRKLKNQGLKPRFINLFLKLLEYIAPV